MNTEEGSSLHFVLTFHISGTHLAKENVIEGQYSLVHVAGVENMFKSRSMQCFAELFTFISKRQAHIPFRNSKLTYLLQPSLSPSGRAIMVIFNAYLFNFLFRYFLWMVLILLPTIPQ